MSAWTRVEKWLEAHAPKIRADLQPPATDKDIQSAEAALSVKFPKDMIDFYRVHNGQIGMAPPLAAEWEFLSLEDAIGQWRIQKELLDNGTFRGAEARASGPVRALWWSEKWIPFAYNGAGDLTCVDLDPPSDGKVGQVIVYWHDRELRERLASGIKEWLTELADAFETGKYISSGNRIVRKG